MSADPGPWYLATDYRDPRPFTLFVDAITAVGLLYHQDVPVVCPTIQAHLVSVRCGVPFDRLRMPMVELLDVSRGVIVLQTEFWAMSGSVRRALEYCTNTGKPVIMMTPGKVPLSLMKPSKT